MSVSLTWAEAEVPYRGTALGVQVLSLSDAGGRRLVLVNADIIWFSDAMVARIRPRLAQQAHTDETSVILSATHTHGSPQPDTRFSFGDHDQTWVRELEEAVAHLTEQAVAAEPRPITLRRGSSVIEPPVAICRRRITWYRDGMRISRRAQSLPNFERQIDDRMTVLTAHEGDGQICAAIVHAACHPVTLLSGAPGPDFPGLLRSHLKEKLGCDVPILFLQGYCGDIRPRLLKRASTMKDHVLNVVIGPRFRPSAKGDTGDVAHVMACAAEKAIGTAKEIRGANLAAARKSVVLNDTKGVAVGRKLETTGWKLAPELVLLATNGEMLSGLASDDPSVMSIGYSNGMAGYIAPAAEYSGGGYEIDGFLKSFGLSERFSPQTEQQFHAVRSQILRDLSSAAA